MSDAAILPTRRLGRTNLRLTELGFGAATLGNLGRPVDDATARAAVERGIAAGVRFFDTAPHYGRGLSERRLGDALRAHDRGGIVLSTKVGRLLLPDAAAGDGAERDGFVSPMPFRAAYDYSAEGISRSFEASLHRLGLDRVDLLLVHDIGRRTHGDANSHYWEQLTEGGGFAALGSLRAQGLVQAIGIGVNEVAACIEAIEAAPIDVVLLAGRYTLLEQAPLDDLFPLCARRGVSVIAAAPYNSGILATGTQGPSTPFYDYGPAPAPVIARVRRIEAIAQAWRVPLPAAALQFPLAHPAVVSVLSGLRDPSEVERMLASHACPIPAGFWEELTAAGLLHPAAPHPPARDQAIRS